MDDGNEMKEVFCIILNLNHPFNETEDLGVALLVKISKMVVMVLLKGYKQIYIPKI